MYVEPGVNSMGQNVIMVSDTTAVKYQEAYQMVTISQKEEGGKDTEFESVYISKNTIIHLAVHFLMEGASHDLSWNELQGAIKALKDCI